MKIAPKKKKLGVAIIPLMYFFIDLFGFFLCFMGLAGLATGSMDIVNSIVAIFLGMFMMFMGFIMIFSVMLQKKLFIFFKKLKRGEKYGFGLDREGTVWPFIFQTKYEGMAFDPEIKGWVEETGKSLRTWFGAPLVIFVSELGVTWDYLFGTYFSKLNKRKDGGILNYEDAIHKALGDDLYKEFCEKFRKKPECMLNKYDVSSEFAWILDKKSNAKDKLMENVFGTEIDFFASIAYMKYINDSMALENAVEGDRIDAYETAMNYRPKVSQAIMYAVAVVIIIIGVIIGLYMLQNVNLGSLMSGFSMPSAGK